jgi:murein DD-endopeptidase MepM/ murein hydrolase activator NlpD
VVQQIFGDQLDGNFGLLLKNIILLMIFSAMLWLLSGCSPANSPEIAETSLSTLLAESIGITAELSVMPTETAAPLVKVQEPRLNTLAQGPTLTPPAAITAVPTTFVTPQVTATATVTPTPKPSPTTEPDRYCPETAPLKPEYSRFFLSSNRWPAPDLAIAGPHFWLSKPLPGAGRTLINQRFPYGWDENGRLLLHNGVDIAEDLGTPVLAVADGTVIVAQSDLNSWYGWRCDWYGHLVVIELDQKWLDQPVFVLYGHILNLKVEAGDRVVREQPLAEIGIGGAATNPHLHLEVRIGENEFSATRNPMLWIDPGPTRGVIVGRLVDPQGRPWQGVPLALVDREGTEGNASTWSYLGDPQQLMNPDEGWAENFVFSDIQPGEYDIYTSIQGFDYRQPVTVKAGEVVVVEIETKPLVVETPAAEVTAEPGDNDQGE